MLARRAARLLRARREPHAGAGRRRARLPAAADRARRDARSALRLLVAPAVMAVLSLTLVAVPPVFLMQSGMACGINSLAVAHIYGLDLRITAAADRLEHRDRARRRERRRRVRRAVASAPCVRSSNASPGPPCGSTAPSSGRSGPACSSSSASPTATTRRVCDRLADKVAALRIFEDAERAR